MKRELGGRRIALKLIVVFLFSMVFLTGFQVKDVKAAGMSYNKAVMLYNNTVIGKWAKSGKKFKVTDDFRANGCWTAYNDVGKKVTLKPLYGDHVRYIFKDLDGDKTVEALLYMPGYVSVFTIKSGKVKTLAVIRTPKDFGAPDMYYNKGKKTFTLRNLVTSRSVTTKVFRFKNGKLTRLVTLGDYVGQMDTNGKIPHSCWINKKRASITKYKKYMKTYVDSYKKVRWGP